MVTIFWIVDSCSGNSQVTEKDLFKRLEGFEQAGYTVTGFEFAN